MRIEFEHKKSSLMCQRKEELVDYIQCLESNNNALWNIIDEQYKMLLALNGFKKEDLEN